MPATAEQIKSQLAAFAKGLTLRQKITVVGGAAAVAGAIWVFVVWLDKADYKTLYSGLAPGDAQSLSRRLAEMNIPYELTGDGGGIRVPASQLDKARLNLAAEGLPQSGRMGFELFDRPNWAGSDFAEKVNYQRALEGELERTIQTLGEIQAARVHLALPQEALFTEQERPAKASVVVKLRHGRLSGDAQEAITHLVASAVENLKPENVTLVNADGGTPILAAGGQDSRPRSWGELETTLAQKAVATLEPVVGPGRARASVTVEYELATNDSTQEIYDPNGSVVLTSQSSEERESDADMGPAGAPGTASNVPGKQPPAPPKPAADFASPSLHSDSKTFAVSRTVRHTVEPSGTLKRITAAVLVDDATESKEEEGQPVETRRKRTPEEMKQFEQLVAAAIGANPARGDQVAVQNLSFQSLPLTEFSPPTLIERIAPVAERWINVIRYGALLLLFLLVYLLVLRPIQRQIVATFRELPRQLKAAATAGAALKEAGTAAVAGKEQGAAAEAPELAESPGEVRQAVLLKKNLLDKVKREPATASRLIQNWVREETKA